MELFVTEKLLYETNKGILKIISIVSPSLHVQFYLVTAISCVSNFRLQSKSNSKSTVGENFIAPPTPEGEVPRTFPGDTPDGPTPTVTAPSADNSQHDLSIQSEISSGKAVIVLSLICYFVVVEPRLPTQV